MSTVLIKQIPDDYAEANGLAKYNRSRMPGCKDRFAAAIAADGRFVTGFDEDATGVSLEDKPKIAELRANLEKRTGKDLSGVSPFWEDFYVVIEADKPRIFNTDNAMDQLSLKMLIANKKVAPSKDDTMEPDYRDAQYYAYTEESEVSEEITTRKKRDRAIVELIAISENKEKMILYGQYLEGLKYHEKLGPDTLYKMLRAYIEDKDIKNAANFLAALAKSVEELQQKVIVDRSLKQGLIKRSGAGKKTLYQLGAATLGSTVEEVYKNLSTPDFAPELVALQSQLDKK